MWRLAAFRKNFYVECNELKRETPESVIERRRDLGVQIRGKKCPLESSTWDKALWVNIDDKPLYPVLVNRAKQKHSKKISTNLSWNVTAQRMMALRFLNNTQC